MTVTFEQAKKLKEIGFDIECREWYNFNKYSDKEDALIHGREFKNWNILDHLNSVVGYASAPTISDALQWIREKKSIPCAVYIGNDGGIFYRGDFYHDLENLQLSWTERFNTHPEAESALLDKILKHLIENHDKS